ncbi:MAG: DUF4190 domain-containing protein [Nanoarchaeota archaeon]|nr:DUF4190 domain-containing protein [Nanoarchaeota archaeon]
MAKKNNDKEIENDEDLSLFNLHSDKKVKNEKKTLIKGEKKNIYAKASLLNGIGTFLLLITIIFASAAIFTSGLAIIFGFIGLKKFNEDNSVGGKKQAIIGIILGFFYWIIQGVLTIWILL